MKQSEDVLIIGVGNLLCSDEGLGVHVARALQANESRPPFMRVLEAGTALFDVVPEMAGYRHVILVDAIRAGREPGTVYRVDGVREILSLVETTPPLSLHDLDLSQCLRMASLLGYLPAHLMLVGAEPASLAAGTELSLPVACAAEKIVALLLSGLAPQPSTNDFSLARAASHCCDTKSR